MEKIRILCYGDSNTWGYISGSNHQRYDKRWPIVLGDLLGNNYEIIEEGLNSRTLNSDDNRPGYVGKNGYTYLIPCLDSHDPLDLVIVMLGTNDLKNMYHKTAKDIGDMLEECYVKVILNKKQIGNKYPKLIIVTPPLVNENTEFCCLDNKYLGATNKSQELNEIYKAIAEKYNCYFISNEILETGIDGLHITKDSHKRLAIALKEQIDSIFNKISV